MTRLLSTHKIKLSDILRCFSNRKHILFLHKRLPILEHGAFEYLFKFNKTEDIDKWHITTDSSYKIGKSRASLTLTQNNTALFTGFISPEYDKPERTKVPYLFLYFHNLYHLVFIKQRSNYLEILKKLFQNVVFCCFKALKITQKH